MGKPELFLMTDPLARVNVMSYGKGEALNWHFDRSQYTTTLLIRPAEAGGEFEYRSGLRSDSDPNYDGVAKLLLGNDPHVSVEPLAAGSLNVFAGKNTAHRITPVRGNRSRLVAVFSYYDRPGVTFSVPDNRRRRWVSISRSTCYSDSPDSTVVAVGGEIECIPRRSCGRS